MNPYRHKLNRVHQSRAGKPTPQGRSRREMDPVPETWSPAKSVTLTALDARLAEIDRQAKGV